VPIVCRITNAANKIQEALESCKRRWVNASPPTKTTNKIFSSTHACPSNGLIAAMIQIAAQIAINATTSLFDWFN